MSATATAYAVPPASKVRMLFVDDESAVLKVLKAAMRCMANEWETHFAETGEDALALVRQQPFDVVVSDMRMPGMNGAQLLNHVLQLHPQTMRFILSGYSDLQDIISCVGVAHQFLHKPCNLADLRNGLKRATQFKRQLQNVGLWTLAGRVATLPSMPNLYLEMLDALQSPTASTQRIADIAAKDPALTAKLLQLSNSAFFGVNRTVNTVGEAIQFLGVGLIQSLALAVPLFKAFDRVKCPAFPLDQIWDHSLQTAVLARWLVHEHLEDEHLAEQAFAAGLLHDIGKLVLADGLPEEYTAILADAQSRSEPLFLAERRKWGATHAEAGGYLLALWGLPFPLVAAVADHHEPRRAQDAGFNLTGIVHVADVLQHERAKISDVAASPLDMDYIHNAGLMSLVEKWRNDLRNGAARE